MNTHMPTIVIILVEQIPKVSHEYSLSSIRASLCLLFYCFVKKKTFTQVAQLCV